MTYFVFFKQKGVYIVYCLFYSGLNIRWQKGEQMGYRTWNIICQAVLAAAEQRFAPRWFHCFFLRKSGCPEFFACIFIRWRHGEEQNLMKKVAVCQMIFFRCLRLQTQEEALLSNKTQTNPSPLAMILIFPRPSFSHCRCMSTLFFNFQNTKLCFFKYVRIYVWLPFT